jgi:hypothetical protein
MSWRISGLSSKPFEHLFGLDDQALATHRAKRYRADTAPGFPCRTTLEDAQPGEDLLLVPFRHHDANTAYAGEGPIFVRERAATPTAFVNEIPAQLACRLISLRAYDRHGMMLEADVIDGKELSSLIDRFFGNADILYQHAHFARRGCFAALITRD